MDTILHSDNQAGNTAAAPEERKKRTAGKLLWDGIIMVLLIWLIAEMGAALGIPVTQPLQWAAGCICTVIPQETAVQIRKSISNLAIDWVADSLSVCGYSRAVRAEADGSVENKTVSVFAAVLNGKMTEMPVLKYAAGTAVDPAGKLIAGNGSETGEGEAEGGNGADESGAEGGSESGNTAGTGDGTEGGDDADENGAGDGSESGNGAGTGDGTEGGDDADESGAEGGSESGNGVGTGDGEDAEDGNGTDGKGSETGENGGEENSEAGGTAQTGAATFLMPAVTGTLYSADALTYLFLTSNFYNISSSTVVYESDLNGSLLSVPLALSEITEEPQILIYHTHSHEFFADSDTSDLSTGIVGVGEYLTELLTGYGYSVLHLTDQFDYVDGVLDRSRAYTCAAARLKEVLAEYPSIEVMIDLHRDGVDDSMRLVTEINGKTTAMIMFFNGMSRTTSGSISYLPNQNLAGNLAFSLQLKVKAEAYYPGFTRKNYIKPYRYNLHFLEKALLIEAGAQTNTLQEVMNAMEPLAVLLHIQLAGLE